MITFGYRIGRLKEDVIKYIKQALDEKSEYVLGPSYDQLSEDEDGDKIGESDGIFNDYFDDGHYTTYRLIRAYKDEEGYFLEGNEDGEGNDFQFYLLESYIPLEVLCEVADAIHFEPLNYLEDDNRREKQ